MEAKEVRRRDRFEQLAVSVAKQALSASGLEITEANAGRTGVLVSSAIGGLKSLQDAVIQNHEEGARKLSPFAGARPNFMKIAPIIDALKAAEKRGGPLRYRLIHTGQHYDRAMSGSFFEELGIPDPDINLEVGSATQAEQTAGIMVAYEKVLLKDKSDLCLVVGDVTSTMACSIVARKMGIPIAHVEGGIRSGDWTMPEEINRVVTDSITNWFFTTSETANENLRRAGITDDRIFFVGNTMFHTLLKQMPGLRPPACWDSLKLEPGKYFVITLHRPANVDGEQQLLQLLHAIAEGTRGLPVVFPVHPRTRGALQKLDVQFGDNVRLIEPVGNFDMMVLEENARIIATDSGPGGLGITPEALVSLGGRAPDGTASIPLDLEGLARLPGGALVVAWEGEGDVVPRRSPGLLLLDAAGRQLGVIAMPQAFVPEATGPPSRGVRPNLAFESLTRTPAGRLFTGTEGPLLQDDEEPTFERGARTRLLEIVPEAGTWRPAREFVYPIEAVPRPPGFGASRGTTGLAELLALDDARLLALERSFVRESGGQGRVANAVRLFLVDLRGADDVSAMPSLRGVLPRPVTKRLVLDVSSLAPRLSPRLAALENFEGLCEGPRLPDGGRTLLLVSDNNFNASQVTAFLLFRLHLREP